MKILYLELVKFLLVLQQKEKHITPSVPKLAPGSSIPLIGHFIHGTISYRHPRKKRLILITARIEVQAGIVGCLGLSIRDSVRGQPKKTEW